METKNFKTYSLLTVFLLLFACLFINCDDTILEKIEPKSSYLVPGNNGIIQIVSLTKNSILLRWEKAKHSSITQDKLIYSVYMSDNPDLDSSENCIEYGINIKDWSDDLTFIEVTKLRSAHFYYFNVLVSDDEINTIPYSMISVRTLNSGEAVYLFSAGRFRGDFSLTSNDTDSSTREYLDSLCRTSRNNSILNLANIKAFISIGPDDSIANMEEKFNIPSNQNIYSPNDVIVAKSLHELLKKGSNVTLHSAGVCDEEWWSGSDSNGQHLPGSTCKDWTVDSNKSKGMAGAYIKTSKSWINSKDRNCNNKLNLLCIGWE